MNASVKARHTVTGLVVDIPTAQFQAMAFTPLGKVWEVLGPETPDDCLTCGPDEEEAPQTEEIDPGVVEDYYDLEDEDYSAPKTATKRKTKNG